MAQYDYLQKFYSQTNEIQKQINQFNLDDLKAKQKASYDLFANPMRLYNNVTFMTPEGPTVSTSKLVFNEEKGEYEIMLPRQNVEVTLLIKKHHQMHILVQKRDHKPMQVY